jgi:hypothetical protein
MENRLEFTDVYVGKFYVNVLDEFILIDVSTIVSLLRKEKKK